MMQLHNLLCSFTLRKLASIWPRPGDGGRNVIGQRAIVNVPGQRGGNITLCAAISLQGLLYHHATLGPYNTAHMITFPNTLHNAVAQDGAEQPRFVVIWDNVSFHRAALVRDWFTNHNTFTVLYLPPYSPFLNPIEELFSAWRWKVYGQPHAACLFCKQWKRHAETLTWGQSWVGYDMQGDISPVAWPGKILLVMWMK